MAETTVNNGVNVDALLAAREALRRRAAGGEVHVAGLLQVAERHAQQDRTCRASIGLGQEQKHKTEFSFEADHPEIFASEDLGATPGRVVLVGLASCLTAGVAAVAQNRGIQLRSVEAKLEGSMDIQGILGIDSDVRNGYDDIKVTFNIDADASKKDIEALVAQSQKRSAVYDIVTNPTNVTVEVRDEALTARRAAELLPIERVTTVVIGAGHAGLAASRCLTERSIDHVVLERGEVANSWRRERWDSLRLLTPNWQSRLPGHRYDGSEPDGFMTMARGGRVRLALRRSRPRAPVRTQTDGHVGHAGRRRLSRRDRPAASFAAAAWCSRAAPATAASCPALRQAVPPSIQCFTAVRLSQSAAAARRRRAGRRRVGHRRAARR